MESWISASRSAPVERVAMVKIAAVVIEVVAIDDRAAVRNVGIVVVNHPMAVPIASPVMPAPSVAPIEVGAVAHSEEDHRAVVPGARIGIPAWPSNNRASIDDPGIVGRNVDDFGADRLDLYVRAFCRNGLLRRGVEMAASCARRRIT
jgi:hypothetical protein